MLTLTNPTHRTTHRSDLTDDQRSILDYVLTELGAHGGIVEDNPPETDAGARQALTAIAARLAGITITPGHEIAQCPCGLVMDGAQVDDRSDEYTRCRACADEQAAEDHARYGD